MKIALIGYGYWGKIVFKYLKKDNFFELVKVFHIELEEKNEIFTNQMDDIILDKTIEAIYIATPVATHFDIIEKAIENGKYIFCEKVLVNRREELDSIKYNFSEKILETNYIYTDSPSINYIKENMKKIGEIKYVEGEIRQYGNFYPDSDVYATIGCHLLSSIIYLFDSNKMKIKFQDIMTYEKQVVKGVMIGFLNENIRFRFYTDLVYPARKRNITLYGEKGIIHFNPLNIEGTVKTIMINSESHAILSTEHVNFEEKDNISFALNRFKDVISGKRKHNLEMSIKISEILLNKSEE